jgi:hypothetical protein
MLNDIFDRILLLAPLLELIEPAAPSLLPGPSRPSLYGRVGN